jgi:hypothetical protein
MRALPSSALRSSHFRSNDCFRSACTTTASGRQCDYGTVPESCVSASCRRSDNAQKVNWINRRRERPVDVAINGPNALHMRLREHWHMTTAGTFDSSNRDYRRPCGSTKHLQGAAGR